MDPTTTKKVFIYAVGAIMGGVTGYFVGGLIAYKVMQAEAERLAEEEYQQQSEEYSGGEDLPPFTVDGKDPREAFVVADTSKSNGNHNQVDYTKFAPKPDNKPELAELVARSQAKKEEPEPGPYIIDQETWANTHEDYQNITINYYEMDTTYSNTDEEVIADVIPMIGPNMHLHFGEQSGDPDVVYVRNDELCTDYEVIRLRKSYKREILGEPEKPSRPKRKGNTGKVNTEKDDDDENEKE